MAHQANAVGSHQIICHNRGFPNIQPFEFQQINNTEVYHAF